ncbi:MAG: hypothetical protein CVU11_16300 [Bacteroidetes bacterium HGW-Bacteroidetes-6]|jgi:hypothetical protein|nr:MAG: hypothetical protein CVU11_16300 [Bacteroidetes bacterium HGW-Bacteroidetes-6]
MNLKYWSIILLFFFSIAGAQNWKVIPNNGSMFFDSTSKLYLPIWLDSVQIDGNDSLIYFSRTIGYSPASGAYQYNKNAACWGGYYARKNSDSTVFYNFEGLKLVFKADARVGEIWNFCLTDSNLIFKAIVDSIVAENFLGQSDSIKSIRIQAYDTSGNLVIHSLNNTITLSKNCGLLKTYAFYSFLSTNEMNIYPPGSYYQFYNIPSKTLVLAGNGTVGVTDFGYMESYDYPLNSEYSVFSGGYDKFMASMPVTENWVQNSLFRIVSKTIYGNNDSISLTYHLCKKTIDYLNDTITYIDSDFSKLIKPDQESDEYRLVETPCGKSATVYSNNNYPIGIVFLQQDENGLISKTTPCDCGLFTYWNTSQDSILLMPCCDMEYFQYSYYKNWGGQYFLSGYYTAWHKNTLTYFNDGMHSWGSPTSCGSILGEKENDVSSLIVFPNPSGDFIHIVLPNNESCNICIFDLSGKTLKQENCSGNTEAIINVSDLKSGLYYILTDGYRPLFAKFIKE